MKRALLVIFSVLGLALLTLAVLVWRQSKEFATAPLTLPDGSELHLLAVTHGTNHIVGTPLARFTARAPGPVRAMLVRLFGSHAIAASSATTTERKLIVWLERSTNAATTPAAFSYLRAFLSDAGGFASGEEAQIYAWSMNPQRLEFGVFPRREPQITVQFFQPQTNGHAVQCGTLTFPNPVHKAYPQWQPESLPAVKRAGDVEVTLTRLSTGHNHNTTHKSLKGGTYAIEFGVPADDGRNNTIVLMSLRPLANTNEMWRVANEEISDATGNLARNRNLGWGGYEQDYFTFAPGLWTNEAAWKLRCEIKRAEGFKPEEQFTFRDVPLGEPGQTNRLGWTSNFNGVTVTLEHLCRRGPMTNNSWSATDLSQAKFTTQGLTNGLHLDLVAARTDTGTNLATGSWSNSGTEREYSFHNVPLDARTVAFTFAVQTGRWVEFTVKPEVGPSRLEYRPPAGK